MISLTPAAKNELLALVDQRQCMGFKLEVDNSSVAITEIISVKASLLDTVMVNIEPMMFVGAEYLPDVVDLVIDFDDEAHEFGIRSKNDISYDAE